MLQTLISDHSTLHAGQSKNDASAVNVTTSSRRPRYLTGNSMNSLSRRSLYHTWYSQRSYVDSEDKSTYDLPRERTPNVSAFRHNLSLSGLTTINPQHPQASGWCVSFTILPKAVAIVLVAKRGGVWSYWASFVLGLGRQRSGGLVLTVTASDLEQYYIAAPVSP